MKKSTCLLVLVLAAVLLLFPACIKENGEKEIEKAPENVSTGTVNLNENKVPAENKEPDTTLPDLSGTTVSNNKKNDRESSDTGNIRYIITKNYGTEMVLNKQVNYQKNSSIIDGLMDTGAEVETSYGGSFVSDINGLNSEKGRAGGVRRDWFYFVNGIFADSGALDYFPQPGEIIWWDYHPWKTSQGTPAVIGCFPEPFLHGYRQKVKATVIMTVAQETEKGLDLQKALQAYGVSDVVVKEINADMLERREGPTVIIGQWQELAKIQWLNEFNEAYQKNGTYLHFTEKGLELMNYMGEGVKLVQDNVGVICATGEGNGDDSPLWIITGTDRSGTEAALELLTRHPEKVQAAYGVAILPGEIIKLPVMS